MKVVSYLQKGSFFVNIKTCINNPPKHVYVRSVINSRRFKISLRCKATSLSAFTHFRANITSVNLTKVKFKTSEFTMQK